jgi:hypothetical protein
MPGRNTVISCPTAEQFALYDILLGMVVQERKLGAFGLDINCQFSVHLKNQHPEIAALVGKFIIGWLHAKAGHGLGCQLNFNGLYVGVGLGRCISEQNEQLWVSGRLLGFDVALYC